MNESGDFDLLILSVARQTWHINSQILKSLWANDYLNLKVI